MYLWEISCTTPDAPSPVTFRVTAYGSVQDVIPAASLFAEIKPLDIYGFTPPGTPYISGDPLNPTIEDAIRAGIDVTGKALVMRALNWPGLSSDLYTRMEPPCQANMTLNFASARSGCSPRLVPSTSL